MRFTIRADYLRVIQANLAKDNVSRPYLNCYRLDPVGKTLTATDGHALVQVPVTVEGNGDLRTKEILIQPVPRVFAAATLVTFTESEGGDFWRMTQESKTGRAVGDAAVSTSDLKYPNLETIIPDQSKLQRLPDKPVAFNPELMARTSRALDAHCDLYFTPDAGPMVLKFSGHEQVLCLVMGCRTS